jgi:tellurite resistance protein
MIGSALMDTEKRLNLLAQVAAHGDIPSVPGRGSGSTVSILALAAASYGSRTSEDITRPTGFDPAACALFESIIEGAFLVAHADGVFDEGERRAFERVVTSACGGTVPPRVIAALVGDLEEDLARDGMAARIAAIGQRVKRREHAEEVLRIAALLALTSEDVSEVEHDVLRRIAEVCGLGDDDVKVALAEVTKALGSAA